LPNCIWILRCQDFLSEYQARRNFACADGSRIIVYVFCPPRLSRWICAMDEAGHCYMLDCIYADNTTVPWLDDFPRQYASWPRHYACRQRSASYCTAIRSRLERKSQYDVRCACNNYGSQSHTLHRKGKVRTVAT